MTKELFAFAQQNFVKIALITVFQILGLIISLAFFLQLALAQVAPDSKSSQNDSHYYVLEDSDFQTGYPLTNQAANPNDPVVNQVQQVESLVVYDNPALPTEVKSAVRAVGLPTVASLAVILTLLPAIISLIPLLFSPQLFLLLLAALFGERKNVWGLIYDFQTKKPIPFAVVRLYQSGSNFLYAQKVTDLQGRYGFVLSKGNYRLEVSQSGYELFKQEIKITHDNEVFTEDIALGRVKAKSLIALFNLGYIKLKELTFKYSIYFAFIGLIFSLVSLYIQSNLLNTVITLFYLGIVLLYFYVNQRNNRTWGVVIDSLSGLALYGATVRIFDNRNNLADTQLTDEKGRFGFFVDPGEYALLINLFGYKYPSAKQQDIPRSSVNPDLLYIKVTKNSKLNLNIKLDPHQHINEGKQNFISREEMIGRPKLASPFGAI